MTKNNSTLSFHQVDRSTNNSIQIQEFKPAKYAPDTTNKRPALASSPPSKRPVNFNRNKRPRLESSKQLEEMKKAGNDNMAFSKSQTRKNLLPYIIDEKTKEKRYLKDDDTYGLPYNIKNMDDLLKVTPWNKDFRRS